MRNLNNEDSTQSLHVAQMKEKRSRSSYRLEDTQSLEPIHDYDLKDRYSMDAQNKNHVRELDSLPRSSKHNAGDKNKGFWTKSRKRKVILVCSFFIAMLIGIMAMGYHTDQQAKEELQLQQQEKMQQQINQQAGDLARQKQELEQQKAELEAQKRQLQAEKDNESVVHKLFDKITGSDASSSPKKQQEQQVNEAIKQAQSKITQMDTSAVQQGAKEVKDKAQSVDGQSLVNTGVYYIKKGIAAAGNLLFH